MAAYEPVEVVFLTNTEGTANKVSAPPPFLAPAPACRGRD